MGFSQLILSPLSCCSTVPQVDMPMPHHSALRQVERPRQFKIKIKFQIKKKNETKIQLNIWGHENLKMIML